MTSFLTVTLVFVLMLFLIRRKVNIGVVMLVGAVALGIAFRLAPGDMLSTTFDAIRDKSTFTLVFSLVLIMFLENIMRKTHMMQRMVTSMKGLVGDHRIVMSILPAFIGLLPSAGGAIFSAPMVEEVARDMDLSPEKKSFVNYWYRHLWEYCFPLYPGLILSSEIFDLPMAELIKVQFPFTISALVLGGIVAFRGMGRANTVLRTESEDNQHLRDLSYGLAPVLLVVFLVLVVKVDILYSLAAVVIALLALNRYTPAMIMQLGKEAFHIQTVLLVVGVMVFKGMLTATGAVEAIPGFFAELGIPLIALVFALPFLVGLITGIAVAYVGVTFPILVGFLAATGMDPRLVALAFVSGFAGVMLSPTHLCLVLTIQYFHSDYLKVLKMMLVPQAVIVLLAAGLYLFVR